MTAAECRCSFFSEAMEIQLVGTSACARRGKDERLFLVSLACQQFKSHGGFHGPEFRSRAVPFSVRRRLCSGEKRPGMVSGLRVFYREPPGYTPRARVFWFPAKRQEHRRYFPPCWFSPSPSASLPTFSPFRARPYSVFPWESVNGMGTFCWYLDFSAPADGNRYQQKYQQKFSLLCRFVRRCILSVRGPGTVANRGGGAFQRRSLWGHEKKRRDIWGREGKEYREGDAAGHCSGRLKRKNPLIHQRVIFSMAREEFEELF